jgi:hypothetical protein
MSLTQPCVTSKPSSKPVPLFQRLRQYWFQGTMIISMGVLLAIGGVGAPAAQSIAHAMINAHTTLTSSMPIVSIHRLCPGSFAPC